MPLPIRARRLPWSLAISAIAAITLLIACGGGLPPAPSATIPATPTAPQGPTTLAASVSQLALAVSGRARTVTITNTGGATAQNLQTAPSGLPAGTLISASNCGGTLAPGASCMLTLTPGNTPTAVRGDLAPAGALLEVAADNSNTLSVNLAVIAYGSVYQGGYVFAIDDTTPADAGIAGKVAALTDLPSGSVWSLSPLDIASSLHENATAPCRAAVDGACNTAQIVAAGGVGDYAAHSCSTRNDGGFNDWYLPAVCELGYEAQGFVNQACGQQSSPLMDNMQSRLVDGGDVAGLSGKTYWTSTTWSGSPASWVLSYVFFASPGTTIHSGDIPLYVRCARAFTP